MTRPTATQQVSSCSFCGRSQGEVERLIAGPGTVRVCSWCVERFSDEPEPQTQALGACSFCGKAGSERRGIVHGLSGVAICTECLALCREIIEEGQGKEERGAEAVAASQVDARQPETEREMLQIFLTRQRDAMVRKLDGLDRDQALRSLVPTGTTLLGMLKHLAYVERWWFRAVLAGENVSFPGTEDDPDAEWRIEQGETVDSIVALYREECAQADQAVSRFELDDLARGEGAGMKRRWITLHMIEETARHCGQADILRELTDGVTGE